MLYKNLPSIRHFSLNIAIKQFQNELRQLVLNLASLLQYTCCCTLVNYNSVVFHEPLLDYQVVLANEIPDYTFTSTEMFTVQACT